MNVKAEVNDTLSLLNWIKKLAAARKKFPGIAYADVEFVNTGSPAVLGLKYKWQGQTLIIINNLSDKPQSINLNDDEAMVNVLEPNQPATSKGKVSLAAFASLWLSYSASKK